MTYKEVVDNGRRGRKYTKKCLFTLTLQLVWSESSEDLEPRMIIQLIVLQYFLNCL